MMRNSTGGSSSSARKSHTNIAPSNEDKNSAKKLVQARLPFKVIAPGSSPASESSTPKEIDAKKEGRTPRQSAHKDTKDGRKRKLSYESEDDVKADEEPNVSKENVEVIAAAVKKKKIDASSSNEIEVVSLLDDDDDGEDVKETTSKVRTSIGSTLKTPKTKAVNGKRKGAGTPQTSSSAHKEKTGSNTKLQIKLPVSAGKRNKRRKSKANASLINTSSNNTSPQNNSCVDSSDDIEEVANELNPQKRTKLDYEEIQKDAEEDELKENTVCLDSELSSEEENNNGNDKESRKNTATNEIDKSETEITENTQENAETKSEEEVDPKEEEDLDESVVIASDDDEDGDVDADDDADDETENNTSTKNANISSDISEDSKSTKHNATIESIKEAGNGNLKNKTLTPKQKKLMEQRQKAREEKERKIQEEKKKKQQEKEGKELAKKQEREEKEEQKRKEREEKEEQKRKEREEKERKRIAEVEAKNEEKRKRNEAKEEEIRKKDEDRKRKEMEKEEAELKKKKAAEAFTKFFVPKAPSQGQHNIEDDENTGDGIKSLAFRPFQVKGDMKLAPICRKFFTDDAKCRLDSLLGFLQTEDSEAKEIVRTKHLPKSKLYLSELRSGKILPGKWRRPSTESKDDVVIIEDDLERVGEAIAEDTPAYIREEMGVKFYKFHDNRRPAYYGTWRKKSSVVTPRKPFAQDKEFFDYEVDSDDEWEEEEPGESIENDDSDEEKSCAEEDDYEVDNEWFVPHGHLSDEEMQNEDETGAGDGNDREAQKAKLQILQQEFAQEMKKKTEKIKPRLIGCIWVEANGNQPISCPKIIWDTLNIRAMLCTDPPVLEEPEVEEPPSPLASNTGNSEKSVIKPVTITDAMVKDLVRLLHGNNNSKNFLIKEYIAYVGENEESVKNGEFANPLKSVIREKIDSIAEWQVVEAVPTSVAQATEATKKKKKMKKRLCWVVNKQTLDKLDMSSLTLQNYWEYILTPKLKQDKESAITEEKPQTIEEPTIKESASYKADDNIADKDKSKCTKSQITKFTKVLTAEEKANILEKSSVNNTSKNSPKDNKKPPDSKAKSPATSKEKKRVPLLMSVGRGQQISTPTKNKLISQFLRKGNKDDKNSSSSASKTNGSSSHVVDDDDDVVILD